MFFLALLSIDEFNAEVYEQWQGLGMTNVGINPEKHHFQVLEIPIDESVE